MSKKQLTKPTIRASAAEYLSFVAASGEGGVETIYADENIWLSQKMMGVLYDVEPNTINYHLKKIFSDNELQEDSVIRDFRITARDNYCHTGKPKIYPVSHAKTNQIPDIFLKEKFRHDNSDKSNISLHIKNIFDKCELQIDSVVANYATTASDEKPLINIEKEYLKTINAIEDQPQQESPENEQ